jgi:hypothetical protein
VAKVPNCGYSLFSLTKMIDLGWTFGAFNNKMIPNKGKNKLTFDVKV